MKLFGDFEAVKFNEENLIFVTHDRFLYYIYNPAWKHWKQHGNAGNDTITVQNYDDVSKEELTEAMQGKFPQKETDFMRLCHPSELCIRDMLDLYKEDYSDYMSDSPIYHATHHLLLESDICFKSYLRLRELFDKALAERKDHRQVFYEIKDLSFDIMGRDIFKREIGIVDGHDSSSYFWSMPVRIVDHSDTDGIDNVAEMRSSEISIEEDDVAQYLTPFLYKYFDDELEANKERLDANGFEWYLTHNFFTFEAIGNVLADIRDTVDALSFGRDNDYTSELRKKRGMATYELLYARDLTKEQIDAYNKNRPQEDDTEIELIVDFYRRFIYRMEYMLKVGQEKGYNLISFMGP